MKKVAISVGILVALLLLVWLVVPPAMRRTRDHNLLLITLDTTRADHLGCYGDAEALTPTLDGLAEQGTLFEHAASNVPLTLPAHATMLTGLLPPEHGLHINGENKLDSSIETLAEIVGERGYSTAAFIASFVLDSTFGLDQGFQVYDDKVDCSDMDYQGLRAYRKGELVVDAALDWLRQQRGPFFCWVHLFDPHKPYHEHEDLFGARFEGRAYDAEIAYADRQVARLMTYLDKSGLSANTLIVIVGDHGEGLGEHGELYHGNTLYESNLHVPLIFVQPDTVRSGQRIKETVSLVDLFPTLTELLCGEAFATVSGSSFASVLSGEGSIEPRDCYAETDEPYRQYGWSPLRAVVSAGVKYIRAPRSELYDLQNDPRELNDLADRRADQVEQLAFRLTEMERAMVPHKTSSVVLTRDDERTLASLGYTAGGSSEVLSGSVQDLPDPKDMLPLLGDAMEAKRLLNEKNPTEALVILQRVVAADPDNVGFRLLLAETLFENGRPNDVVELLQEDLEAKATKMTPIAKLDRLTLMGKCLFMMGKAEDAVDALRAGLQLDRNAVVTLNGLAWILATNPHASQEDVAEAVASAERVAGLTDRGNPSYLDTLAAAYAAAGRFNEAVHEAERARDLAVQQGDRRMTASLDRRLELYRVGRPYLEPR